MSSRTAVCGPFQRAWSNASNEAVAGVISSFDPPNTHEGLVDLVALKLFPSSRYVYDLEKELFEGRRHTSTVAAICWLKNRVARYLRICDRQRIGVTIGSERLRETCYRRYQVQLKLK